MSYIDTIDHEFVGFFGHLPVYHPLETVSHNTPSSADFNCDPTNLIIGGGSGEHPALVLRRPDCAVAHFVTDWLTYHQPTITEASEHTTLWYPGWDVFLDAATAVPSEVVFHFAAWDTKTYHDFYQRCMSKAMYTPYDPTTNAWFEWWLAACLGECIFFSFPELIPTLEEVLPGMRTIITRPSYVNILTPPPGITVPYGSVRHNGKRVQGINCWWQKA